MLYKHMHKCSISLNLIKINEILKSGNGQTLLYVCILYKHTRNNYTNKN